MTKLLKLEIRFFRKSQKAHGIKNLPVNPDDLEAINVASNCVHHVLIIYHSTLTKYSC